MKAFFFYKGLKEIAKELNGNERIYLGVRPYGFHAGNMVPFVAYPLLLCREMKKLRKEPKFTFYIFLNDWEQDKLDGPNTKMYPFNVQPLNTTFQYVLDPSNPKRNIVDYWEPIILKHVFRIKEENPHITIKSIRNSEMKFEAPMERNIIKTIKSPTLIAKILKKITGKKLLNKPLAYALAVCPECKFVRGETKLKKRNVVTHTCYKCGITTKGGYRKFDYWFYHKMLALPRLEICNIDLCITGFDHYLEGDFSVRQELIKTFRCKAKFPKTLYTQLVVGADGQILEKQKGDIATIEPDILIELIENSGNEKIIQLKNIKPKV